MADYLVTDTELTSVANAIRTKGGTSADLSFPTGFVSAINDISTGGYDATLITNWIIRSITDLDFPSGIQIIGNYAFAGCGSFNPQSLPSTIARINDYAFYNCTSLALTSLPSNITEIRSYAFYGCSHLALTSLPSGISSIPAHGFEWCSSLALTSLPSGISLLGDYAFNNCSSLALTSLPSGITNIPLYGFANCFNLALTSLPSGVKTIQNYAFQNCESIDSISCTGAITSLGYYSFNGSSSHPMSLTSASFPNMTLNTLYSAFGNTTASNACQQLAFLDIGSTKTLGSNAFTNCYSLETLILRRSDAICSLSATSVFTNTPMAGYNNKTGTVYVPSALISTYRTATNWKTLYDAGTLNFVAIEGSPYELS